MGRLENIIARNQRPNQMRERLAVSIVFGAILLLILALMVFTDLGLPPGAPAPGPAVAPGGEPAPRGAPVDRGKHVDGILLRSSPPARPTR